MARTIARTAHEVEPRTPASARSLLPTAAPRNSGLISGFEPPRAPRRTPIPLPAMPILTIGDRITPKAEVQPLA